MGEAGHESRYVAAPDGLALHVRVYGGPQPGRLPLVCLAGLSRNAADFDVLARAIAADRQVIAPDCRGRGLSDWDPNWQNYALPVELDDVLAVAADLGIERAVFLGTSRGGLLTMMMPAARPGMVAGAVLNDIGPVIEVEGLARIKAYLGRFPAPATLDEAAALLKSVSADRFPALTDDDWLWQAAALWTRKDGQLVPAFDPALTRPMEAMSFDKPLPPLWPQFDSLAGVPVMVVRGEFSDIIAPETVAAMAARRPDLEVFEVRGQGHAPLLTDAPSIERIAAFARRCDEAA